VRVDVSPEPVDDSPGIGKTSGGNQRHRGVHVVEREPQGHRGQNRRSGKALREGIADLAVGVFIIKGGEMQGGSAITVGKVTEWQASWAPEGTGEPGINTIQVILDGGAAEYVYAQLTSEDGDNLFDWLSAVVSGDHACFLGPGNFFFGSASEGPVRHPSRKGRQRMARPSFIRAR
jgi:hypothetical protein